jgi:DNA-binding transcriptional LysR family regulator
VLDLLHAGRVDLAFSSKPADPELFESRRCFDTHYIFVAAPDYPCDFAREYALRELAAMPLILLDHKASSRDFLEKFFLQNGLELRPAFELGTHDLQLALARIGLGVAGVTEEFSRSSLDRGVLRRVRVTPEPPARSVQVCTLRGVAPTEAARRFVDLLREKG